MSCLPPYVSLIARDGPLKLTSQQNSRTPARSHYDCVWSLSVH